ncbi:MAG: EscU/YscU/HrcU family type III secretion system export apparatus switch protein [Polyangiaceae bacterium]
MSEKTEEPTPQRLRKAQEEGDRGLSPTFSQSVGFVLVLAVLPAWSLAMFERTKGSILLSLSLAKAPDPTNHLSQVDTWKVASEVLVLTLPVLALAAVGTIAASVVQGGGPLAWKRLSPKVSNLDLVRGFRNLWSGARAFAIVRSLALALLALWLGVKALRVGAVDLASLASRPDRTFAVLGAILLPLLFKVGALGLVFGTIDLLVVRRDWKRRLRMSKDEVKREHRENDGDPELKAARERAHREVMAQINVAAVKRARVVVVNPTHLACALRYDEAEGDETPTLIAFGEGDLAQRLLQAAREYGVPILRNVTVARALRDIEIGDAIPEALYEAVAEILREIDQSPTEAH